MKYMWKTFSPRFTPTNVSKWININSRCQSTSIKDHAEVVVIGGGAVGVSTAYNLAKKGVKDVVLLEKSELTAGSTWHAAGLVTSYHPGINLKNIHYTSLSIFSQLERETGQAVGLHRVGSIRLATSPLRVDELKYQMQRHGWHKAPQYLISPEEVKEIFPLMNTDTILAGLYTPSDGHIDPYSVTQAMAAGARRYGAKIVMPAAAEKIRLLSNGKWEITTTQGIITATHVVNAAGFWAREVGNQIGIELPLVAVHHQYLVTSTLAEVKNLKRELPVIRHLDGSFYLRQERDGLLCGPYEGVSAMKLCDDWVKNGVPKGFGKELFPPDLDRLSSHLEVAMDLVPCFKTANIQSVVAGPMTYAPDLLPMVGPYQGLHNYWTAVGFGYGIIQSGGIGKYLAEWIINGEPSFDLIEVDPNRFGKWTTKKFLFEKARESYGMNNAVGFPKEERFAGRPTSRLSGAHKSLVDRGAHMIFQAGWEKPAWFALEGDEKGYKPNFRRTNWFKPVIRECQNVLENVGVIDLSPFGKFEVSGKDAYDFLNILLANNIPQKGITNISHMLTPKGKVYAELTVTNLGDDKFLCLTGAASEFHDLRWMEQHARSRHFNVNIRNVTEDLGCLSIGGPKSRLLLSKLTAEDVTEAAFPFLTMKNIQLAGIPVTAIRISYTGELGWELYHNRNDTKQLYEALIQSGQEYNITDFGLYALNSLRIEKGFRAWGSDMTVDTNPFEAGLGMFIKLRKDVDFIGKSGLQEILRQGLTRQVVSLTVDTDNVDPEGNESIWFGQRVVGYTTSGSYSCQLKKGIALANLPIFLATKGIEVFVELLGSLRPATVLVEPPFKTDSVRTKQLLTKK